MNRFPNLIRNAAWILVLSAAALRAQETAPATAFGRPFAVLDLRTSEGAARAGASWRVAGARIVAVAHREPGPDLKPSGAENQTFDVEPRAGEAGFDEAEWERVAPEALEARRGHGRLGGVWYRTAVTVPESVAGAPVRGATVVFEVVVDDYAEVWVDGKLPQVLGQSGGPLVRGWNAPNRVVLTRDARAGQVFRLAVFGVNAPLSRPPGNFIWIRSATLDFHRPPELPAAGRIVRLDPGLDAVLDSGARIERLAGGFTFTEGPVWHPEGFLLFSDPDENTIWRWNPDRDVSVFRAKSGYAGADIGRFRQPGSNGLALDAEGRLTVCEHGRRRVVRIERNGTVTVLAHRFEGRRLNSPNDLVWRSDGTLYFTDPPFGLPGAHDDPGRELGFSGVYALKDGVLRAVSRELRGPNGLAFSPDERRLYVTNWDESRKVVMRHEVLPDGSLGKGVVFADFGDRPEPEALDGIEVTSGGHVLVSAPGGLWVLSPEGRRLGRLELPEPPSNLAFGEADGRTLFLTARTGLYRVRLVERSAGS